MSQQANKRRKYIVDPDFQYGLIRKMAILAGLIIIAALSSLALVFYLYGDVQVEVIQPIPFASSDGLRIVEENTILGLLWPVMAVSLLVTLVVIFLFGLVVSHRMAGPVFSMRRTLGEMSRGDLTGPIRLRKSDAFKSLADEINGLRERWRVPIQEIQSLCRGLNSGDNSKQKEHLNKLCKLLSTFKTE